LGPVAAAEIVEEQAQARKFWFGTPIEEAREKIESLLQSVSPTTQNHSGLKDGGEDESEELNDIDDDDDGEGI
jgi:hypothetical protein